MVPIGLSTFGGRLKAARGEMLLDDAAYLARQELPPALSFSRETLRRMETGIITETKANPFHVAALAQVYGVKVSDLSTLIADEWRQLCDLVSRTPA